MAFEKIGIKDSLETAFKTAQFLQSSEQNFYNLQAAKQERDYLVKERQKKEDFNRMTQLASYINDSNNIADHINNGTKDVLVSYIDQYNQYANKYKLPTIYSLDSIISNTRDAELKKGLDEASKYWSANQLDLGDEVWQKTLDKWGTTNFNYLDRKIIDRYQSEQTQKINASKQNLESVQIAQGQYMADLNNLDNTVNDRLSKDETYQAIGDKVLEKTDRKNNGSITPHIQNLIDKYSQNPDSLSEEQKQEIYNSGYMFGGKVGDYDLTGVETGKALSNYKDAIREEERHKITDKYRQYGNFDIAIERAQKEISDLENVVPITTGAMIWGNARREACTNMYNANWKLSHNPQNEFQSLLSQQGVYSDNLTKTEKDIMFDMTLNNYNAPQSVKDEIRNNKEAYLNSKPLVGMSYDNALIETKGNALNYSMTEAKAKAQPFEMFMNLANSFDITYADTENDINNAINRYSHLVAYCFDEVDQKLLNDIGEVLINKLNSKRSVALDNRQQEEIQRKLNNEASTLGVLKSRLELNQTQNAQGYNFDAVSYIKQRNKNLDDNTLNDLAVAFQNASAKYNIPLNWLMAISGHESGGFVLNAKSNKGASGLMQIMPPTFKDINNKLGGNLDINNPIDNIEAGAYYLNELSNNIFGVNFDQLSDENIDVVLRAYNGGPKHVKRDKNGNVYVDNDSKENKNYPANVRKGLKGGNITVNNTTNINTGNGNSKGQGSNQGQTGRVYQGHAGTVYIKNKSIYKKESDGTEVEVLKADQIKKLNMYIPVETGELAGSISNDPTIGTSINKLGTLKNDSNEYYSEVAKIIRKIGMRKGISFEKINTLFKNGKNPDENYYFFQKHYPVIKKMGTKEAWEYLDKKTSNIFVKAWMIYMVEKNKDNQPSESNNNTNVGGEYHN